MTRKLPVAMTLFAALLVGVALVVANNSGPAGPQCSLHLGDDNTLATAFAEVTPELPVQIHVRLPEPTHVWVASWDETDGTLALFPSPWLRTTAANPLAAGTHELPGRNDDKKLSWPARVTPNVTHYLVVASRSPLPDLDDTFARLRQASNTTFLDGSMTITAPKNRSITEVPPREPIAHPLLAAAAAVTGASGHTTMRELPEHPGVWVASFQVVPPPTGEPKTR